MNRIVRPWKPLTCCIATLFHLTSPFLASAQQNGTVSALETTQNAIPVIDDPLLQADGTTKKIDAKIPVGKTLLIPIAAKDDDGDPLSYKVTSSSPKVMVRARTGRPHLKVDVSYAGTTGETGADPQFSGTLDLQLFRDWTPETAGFIGGFAQSLFYSPKPNGNTEQHTIFHRVVKDFMCQGGDPNGQLPDPDSGTPLERGPGFSFENEFDIPLLFSGRGQLAMANAGSNSSYKGTNGSQFFITTSSPRFLDVKHTIFGQIVRGWELLEKMQNVPVKEQSAGGEVSRPKTDIKITGTSLVPNFSDALLVLSATGATPENSPATITVEVTDGKGGTATRTLQVQAVVDEFNTPPIFTKLPADQVVPVGKITSIPVRGVDLEQDYFIYENSLLPSFFPRGQSNRGGNPMLVLPDSSNPGTMTLGFWMRQLLMAENSFEFTENEFQRQGQRDRRSITLGVNDLPLRTQAMPVTGVPGVTLTSVPVATFVDTDARGQAGNNTVSINWGDGTAASSGVLGQDTTRPAVGAYKIVGSHSYVRKGVYPIVVTITSTKGLKQVVRSTAVITDGALRPVGQTHTIKGRGFTNKPLVNFTDTAANTTPADYEATLDWGDGQVTAGEVRKSPAGQLYVTGTHNYQDPETFSVAVRLHKKGTAPESDAYSWATLEVTGFEPAQQHLPPFPMAHIVGLINPVLKDAKNPNTSSDDEYKPIRTTAGGQTTFAVGLSILNNGNKAANASKIRFYLSADRKLNLNDETYTEGTGDDQVTRTNPKDIALTIGKKQKELSIIALKSGQGGGITFDRTSSQDTRLFAPKGEDGTGYYLLAAFVYDDPLVKQLPVDTEVAYDIAPVFTANPTAVEVTEYEGPRHTQEFAVVFHRRPSADVTLPLKIVTASGLENTDDAIFTDAPAESKGKLTLTYTRALWDQGVKELKVKVTGQPDAVSSSTDATVYVQMGPAVSSDPIYHQRFTDAVRIVNRDVNSFLQVSPITLQTKEVTGTDHTKTFTVKMMQKPTKDVIVPVVIGDATEGQITGETVGGQSTLTVIDGKPSLKFTPSDTYPLTRTITVTSIDDNVADGDITYDIVVGPSTSEDPRFQALNPPHVTVTNVDNPPATSQSALEATTDEDSDATPANP